MELDGGRFFEFEAEQATSGKKICGASAIVALWLQYGRGCGCGSGRGCGRVAVVVAMVVAVVVVLVMVVVVVFTSISWKFRHW